MYIAWFTVGSVIYFPIHDLLISCLLNKTVSYTKKAILLAIRITECLLLKMSIKVSTSTMFSSGWLPLKWKSAGSETTSDPDFLFTYLRHNKCYNFQMHRGRNWEYKSSDWSSILLKNITALYLFSNELRFTFRYLWYNIRIHLIRYFYRNNQLSY